MNQTTQFLIGHGLAVIFTVVLAEQMGIPIPALPWLMAAGALSAGGKFPLFLGISATVLACLLGDTFWFFLGRRRGTQVLGLICRISLEPDSCVRRTQNVFTRFGLRGLLVAKFVPGLSTVAPPLAGMAGVPVSRFILVDAAGSLAYAVFGLGCGYFFSRQISQLLAAIGHIGSDALGLLLGVVVLYVAYKFWQRQRLLRELRAARITVAELRQRLDAGENVVILDLRSGAELKLNPTMIRGAIHVDVDRLGSYGETLPRDRDVVVYCSCPNEVTSARFALSLQKKGFTRIRPLLGGIDAWRQLDYPMDPWTATA